MKPPTKWHLARVGALTWALGMITGWVFFSRAPPATLEVPGATGIELDCPGYQVVAERSRIPLGGEGVCSVKATLGSGRFATGKLRVTLRGTQICRPSGEDLTCDSSAP